MDVTESISVIIPVYNCERYLGAAIESVLAQTLSPREIIVVDDGSDDGTAAVAQQFGGRVRYDYQTHGGIGAARNHGLEMADSRFLAFLDADDLWTPNKLQLQAQAFGASPGIDMVFGFVEQFISPELDEAQRARLVCPSEPAPGYLAGTLLIRHAAMERIGAFRADLSAGEFIDWYARATDIGLSNRMLPDVLLKRRLHTTNQSLKRDGRRPQLDFLRVVKGALDRRRGESHDVDGGAT